MAAQRFNQWAGEARRFTFSFVDALETPEPLTAVTVSQHPVEGTSAVVGMVTFDADEGTAHTVITTPDAGTYAILGEATTATQVIRAWGIIEVLPDPDEG